jgi:lysophospholipase L1-like esterase
MDAATTSSRTPATLRARPVPALVPAQRSAVEPVPLPVPPAPTVRPQPRRRRAGALLAGLALLLLALPASAAPERPAATAVRAYFFGDSLMTGTGASPTRPVMARVAAARLGWDVEVDAWGGTGWTTTGRSPGYLERLRRPGALGGRYDLVLLEGGTNDARIGSAPATVRAAVHEVVAEVRRRQPQAQIVIMGAYDPPGVVDLRRGMADAAVRAAADELGVPFFSPWSGRWPHGHAPERFLSADGLHPDEDGYGVMGHRLAVELAAVSAGRSSAPGRAPSAGQAATVPGSAAR